MVRAIIALVLLALPIAASAADRIVRLAELVPSAGSLEVTRRTTLAELAKPGFREGHNLIVEEHAGDASTLPAIAREVVGWKPDAILAIGGNAAHVARDATRYRSDRGLRR